MDLSTVPTTLEWYLSAAPLVLKSALRRAPSESGILFTLVVVVLVIGTSRPGFLTADSEINAATQAAFFGIMPLGIGLLRRRAFHRLGRRASRGISWHEHGLLHAINTGIVGVSPTLADDSVDRRGDQV